MSWRSHRGGRLQRCGGDSHTAKFIDRTLLAGKPQGPAGPLAASKAFRNAVPDLRAEIEDMVARDRVSAHLHFHHHNESDMTSSIQ